MIQVSKGRIKQMCLAVLILVLSESSHSDTFLCKAERVNGFAYDQETETWGVSSLSVENRKYLISRTDEKDIFSQALKFDYEIRNVDSPKPIIQCKAAKLTDSNEETGLVLCRGYLGESFNFDKRSGRYIRSQPTGYVTKKTNSEIENGPYIEIGNCSPN